MSGRPFRHTLFFYNEEKRGLENEMMISRPALDLHPKGRPARNILSLDPLEIKIVFFLFLSERPLTAAQKKEKKGMKRVKIPNHLTRGIFLTTCHRILRRSPTSFERLVVVTLFSYPLLFVRRVAAMRHLKR